MPDNFDVVVTRLKATGAFIHGSRPRITLQIVADGVHVSCVGANVTAGGIPLPVAAASRLVLWDDIKDIQGGNPLLAAAVDMQRFVLDGLGLTLTEYCALTAGGQNGSG